MAFRIVLIVLVPLVLAGCVVQEPAHEKVPGVRPVKSEVAQKPSCEDMHVAPTETSERKALRGLESLTRVRVIFPPHVTEALRAEVGKQLREQLPQLNTAGSADDWTLEFVFGEISVPDPMISAPDPLRPVPKVQVTTCRCRLFRTAVVDGRFATAVAYEGPLAMAREWPGFRRSKEPESEESLLKAIRGFADAWHKANPAGKEK